MVKDKKVKNKFKCTHPLLFRIIVVILVYKQWRVQRFYKRVGYHNM